MSTNEEQVQEIVSGWEAHKQQEQDQIKAILGDLADDGSLDLIEESDPHDVGGDPDPDTEPTPRAGANPTEAAIRAFEIEDLDTAKIKAQAALPKLDERIAELDAQVRAKAKAIVRSDPGAREMPGDENELFRLKRERDYIGQRSEYAALDEDGINTKIQSLEHQVYEAESQYSRTLAEETERRKGRFTQRGQVANPRNDPRSVEARALLHAKRAELRGVTQEQHRRNNLDSSFSKSVDRVAHGILKQQYQKQSLELEARLKKDGASANAITAAQAIRSLPVEQQGDYEARLKEARKEATPRIQNARDSMLFGKPPKGEDVVDKGERMRAMRQGRPVAPNERAQPRALDADVEAVRARVRRDNERRR